MADTVIVIVDSDDLLTQLAQQYCTTVSEIIRANQLRNQEDLSPGERLTIPYIKCDK